MRSWAASAAAITAGSLPSDLRDADRTNEPVQVAFRQAHLPREAHEAGALGFRSDQADEIEAAPPQGRERDVEVERVRVRHHHDHGVARRLGQFALDRVGADRDDILRHILRKLIRAAVDPAHTERQRRQRQHHGAPDMAGAEQKNRRGHFAEMLLETLRVEGARRLFRLFAARRDPPPGARCGRRHRRGCRSRKAPAFSASSSRRTAGMSVASKVSVSVFTAPPQHWPRLGPSGQSRKIAAPRPAESAARAAANRLVFQAAAADRAVKAAVGLQHDAGAGFARDGAGGANDAQQPGFAVPLDRFANAGPDLGHRLPVARA